MAKLMFNNGPQQGKAQPLDNHAPLVIGRHDDCDLAIKDAMISGHHARIEWSSDEGWTVTDLDSSNGTSVNGTAVVGSAAAVLSDGAQIILGGSVQLRFVEEKVAEAGKAAPAPAAAAKVAAPVKSQDVAPAAVASKDDLELVQQMRTLTDKIRTEVAKVIIGQAEVLDQVLMVLIAGGHGLLVGMPGMAKTTLVSTIAKVLDMQFKRVQFTPDLMPTDITGTEVLETNKETMAKEFRFIPGPIFCNILLADEINRTPPKTQASLLEAMQEKRVTIGNMTYTLDKPFFVLATQNPIEQEGTYPLPEAQMDRFMFNIWLDYPLEHEEEAIIKATTVTQVGEPQKVLGKEQILQLQSVVRKIPVSDHVIKYTIRLVRATRPGNETSPDFIKQYVSTGSGPRAGQYLVMAAKARAVLEGRIHVSCSDIRRAAIPVLRHRILTNFAADSEGLTPMMLVERLLKTIEEPSEKDYAPEAAAPKAQRPSKPKA